MTIAAAAIILGMCPLPTPLPPEIYAEVPCLAAQLTGREWCADQCYCTTISPAFREEILEYAHTGNSPQTILIMKTYSPKRQ